MDQRVLLKLTSLILTKDPNYTVENESVLIFHDLPSVLKMVRRNRRKFISLWWSNFFLISASF